MRTVKHLTRNQLSAYNAGLLAGDESNAALKHLLMCAECRKLMPLPTVDEFWSAIMTENVRVKNPAGEKSGNLWQSFSSVFSPDWNLRSGLVWTSGLVIILLSFMFWLRMDGADSSNDIARSFNISDEQVSELNYPPTDGFRDNDGQISSDNINRPIARPTQKKVITNLPKPNLLQNNFGRNPEKNVVKEKAAKFSLTRGVLDGCSEEKAFELEFSPEGENFVFRWKKVPKAVNYHLYISDDDEVLIDEFETTEETSFILRKPLDPLKTYKWKIIVTLENGQTVVGTSSSFTVKNFQTNQVKREKKANSAVRCAEK